MALTREQYNRIMSIYQERRLKAQADQEARQERAFLHVPALSSLFAEQTKTAVLLAKAKLSGDRTEEERLARLFARQRAEKARLLKEGGFPEDYLELRYVCPVCRDTGYVGSEKCGCLKKLESELIYASAGLPEQLRRENFDAFRFDVYDDTKPIEALRPRYQITQRLYMKTRIYPSALRFAEEFEEKPGENLFLTGPTGTGKTYLSNCIARAVTAKCHSVFYTNAADLFDLFSEKHFGGTENELAAGRIEEAYRCELLIIDDLGSEMGSSFTNSRLFMIINHRLSSRLSTIISSNLSLNQIRNNYGDRVVSRLMGNYTVLPFYGADLRLRPKLDGAKR